MSKRASGTDKTRPRKRRRKGREPDSETAEAVSFEGADAGSEPEPDSAGSEGGTEVEGTPSEGTEGHGIRADLESAAGAAEATGRVSEPAGTVGDGTAEEETAADSEPAGSSGGPDAASERNSARNEPGGANEAAPESPRDLQTLVTRLLGFWMERGCTLLPPVDFPVPAATLHPDVFFRFLDRGPESSVFLQPVRRPMDRRDGRHPFRFSRPLQLEVIWSGPGAQMQSMFVDSLRDVGLDLAGHDLYFADGLYESRTLAARGMSWHATLDGLGVARMSFVHQALGREVDPPVCEVVYGLERLAMVLWGVDRADDLAWREGGESRGDLFGGLEKEYSAYLTRAADLGSWSLRLEHLEREARRCLEEGLLGTAYELAIRCLEGIDLLTVRGDLDLRARGERLDSVRELVLAVAEASAGGSAEATGDA